MACACGESAKHASANGIRRNVCRKGEQLSEFVVDRIFKFCGLDCDLHYVLRGFRTEVSRSLSKSFCNGVGGILAETAGGNPPAVGQGDANEKRRKCLII